MKKITQKYVIKSPIQEVWKALVDPKYIEGWGGGPAKMSDKVGSNFSLWGGDIHGKNIEVVINKKLVQEWFSGKWSKPSVATFNLSSKNDETTIEFTHENVPEEEFKDIEQGWCDYYLGPLKDYLENK